MTQETLWFLLSGFVLGLAISTLWEWLYYRGRRLQWRDQRIAELENELAQQHLAQREQPDTIPTDEPDAAAHRAPASPNLAPVAGALGYRSQAALLRSEQESEDQHL